MIDDKLTDALARGRVVAARLGAATDKLNEALLDAETHIAALHLDVRAAVRLQSAVGWLGFGKCGRAWRLLFWPTTPEVGQAIPLTSAPRRVRVAAADLLFNLVVALIATAEGTAAELEHGVQTAARFSANINNTICK